MITRCELITGFARFATVADYKTDVDGRDQSLNTQVRVIEIPFHRDPQREKEAPCQRLIGSARIAP